MSQVDEMLSDAMTIGGIHCLVEISTNEGEPPDSRRITYWVRWEDHYAFVRAILGHPGDADPAKWPHELPADPRYYADRAENRRVSVSWTDKSDGQMLIYTKVTVFYVRLPDGFTREMAFISSRSDSLRKSPPVSAGLSRPGDDPNSLRSGR